MSVFEESIDDAVWAAVAVTFVIGVVTITTTIVLHFRAERKARKQHEATILQAGYAALQRGDHMDLMIHYEFWRLAEEEEARLRALGATGESLSVRFAAARGRGVPLVNEPGD